ncbi:MAG TPA: molybdopterin molybdotransferase MoeA, partial [Leptospiraceae bacterium]|nr:molybdopterin molybdotransferase MoeA [Leptospiraceae bacterium]
MISVQKAIELILDNTHTTNRTQKLPIYYAKNFILAQEIFSDRDYPPFNRATMDGYAIRFNDFSIDRQWNVIGEIYAGDNWDYPNLNRELPAIKIMTGAAVPEDFDVVIKIEDTNRVGNKIHILSEKVKQWMNIAKKGEDTQSGNTIVSQGTLIDDSILTIAGSMGQLELNVFEPPTVSIFSTGNEIVPMGQIPNSNQIRDSNTILIESMFQNFKSKIKRKVLLPDDLEIIKNHLDQSSDSDFCVITGGVSAGDKDYIPKALESIGAKEIFHKAMIRPGKPIWFGKKDNTLFFGLPGNPFS